MKLPLVIAGRLSPITSAQAAAYDDHGEDSAAFSEPRKLPTSAFSRSDCDDKPLAASSSLDAASPASSDVRETLTMLLLTLRVPSAAC